MCLLLVSFFRRNIIYMTERRYDRAPGCDHRRRGLRNQYVCRGQNFNTGLNFLLEGQNFNIRAHLKIVTKTCQINAGL